MTEQHHDAAEVTEANKLTREFFLSTSFDPKPARPADTVEAAIAFTLAASEARLIAKLQSEQARERVASMLHGALSQADVINYLNMPGDTADLCATAALSSIVDILGEGHD